MKRRIRLLSPAALTLAFACSESGEVGSPCEVVEDCKTGLVCDVHNDMGTCQEEDHGHATADEASGSHEHTEDHSHAHDMKDVSDWADLPEVQLEATKDAMGGWALQIHLNHFELAPSHASTESQEGEGHMHLYVDETKLTRVYGQWFHLADLEPGKHKLRVELSANDHSPLAEDDVLIDDTVTVTQPEEDPHVHGHGELAEVEGGMAPAVELTAHKDPKSGWNLEVELENFTLAPENASGSHVDAEGHMHLYVDGKKRGRVYSEWYYLSDLPPGKHEVAIELSTNDHRPYAVKEKKIWATAEID